MDDFNSDTNMHATTENNEQGQEWVIAISLLTIIIFIVKSIQITFQKAQINRNVYYTQQ